MGILYFVALAIALTGMVVLDRRFTLFFWRDVRRATIVLIAGVAFFVVWDLVGIATGVFVKGDSPLLIGVELAPHLPLEEPVFLAFLCYLALVAWAAAERMLRRRRARTEHS